MGRSEGGQSHTTDQGQLHTPIGRLVPCIPNRKGLYCPRRRKEDHLLIQQQAQPMGTITAHWIQSHHHPELYLSSHELLFKEQHPAPQFPPFSLQSTIPLLCVLDLPMVFCYSRFVPNCNSLLVPNKPVWLVKLLAVSFLKVSNV